MKSNLLAVLTGICLVLIVIFNSLQIVNNQATLLRQEELETVARWQSALLSVPPGTGMILTKDEELLQLGKKYNLPVGEYDSMLVDQDRILAEFHSQEIFYNTNNPVTAPITFWYFDKNGSLIGRYDFGYFSPDKVNIYIDVRSKGCVYYDVERGRREQIGKIVVEEVWTIPDTPWSVVCSE